MIGENRPISIWLITVGEPLPLHGRRERPWRTGLLAEELAKRGHEVVWWTSTVDHLAKAYFVDGQPAVPVSDRLTLQFLHGVLYTRNVSIARLKNHRQIGRAFSTLSRLKSKPDIILCSFPTIELSLEAVRYGRQQSVPVVLDIRDLWPDIFADVVPPVLRGVANIALTPMMREAREALGGCDAITGVSEGYLDWGLSKAGRLRQPMDRVFPLGYRQAVPDTESGLALRQRLAANGVDIDQPIAVFVGTFGRSYDLATVIGAARRLQQAGEIRIQFLLCGRGENEGAWRALAEGVPNVFFPGWLNAGELSALLSIAWIGLAAYAPGAPQGVPNKVIEYLSAGLPVLCSLPGEARELLEGSRSGLHYPAGDSSYLTTLLTSISGDSQRHAEMRSAAKSVFAREFSAETVFRSMGNYVEAVVADYRERRIPSCASD